MKEWYLKQIQVGVPAEQVTDFKVTFQPKLQTIKKLSQKPYSTNTGLCIFHKLSLFELTLVFVFSFQFDIEQ